MQAEYFVYQSSVTGVVGLPSDSPIAGSLKPGLEIELLALGDDDVLHIRLGNELVECVAERRSSWRIREACGDSDRGRLCVVRDVQPAQDMCLVTIGVRPLGPTLRLERLQIVLDEHIYEQIRALQHSAKGEEVAHAWLSQRLLLPRLGPLGRPRMLCGRGARSDASGTLERSFSMIGDGLRVDVRQRECLARPGQFEYAIERIAQYPSGRVPAIKAVAEAEVSFVNSRAATEVQEAVDTQLSAIMDDQTTFLGLWKRYQEAEVELRLKRAIDFGSMPYSSVTELGNGRYRLVVAREHLGGARVEAGGEVGILAAERTPEALAREFRETIGKSPDVVLDAEAREAEIEERGDARELFAVVEGVEQGGLQIVVRCREGDAPPAQGWIGASIAGDIVVQQRRAEAVRRIADGSAAMDQLGLIIDESGPLTRRRRRAERPVTPKLIERVFTSQEGKTWRPTPRQREAIDVALNTPDVAVIQGPPGTGKTTVMRAIIERIHELNAENPERDDRFLVTGFQHDAVENAIEKMEVNGLPAMKIGSRRSEKGASDDDEEVRLDGFVEKVVASSSVLARGDFIAHDELRAIEDEIAFCTERPMSAAAAAAVLRSSLERFGPRLSRGLSQRFVDLAEQLERDASPEVDHEGVRLERAIRGIRCTATAFADDGPRNAAHALALLQRRGVTRGLAALERCTGWAGPEAPPFLDEVEALRVRLLLAHVRRRGSEAIAVVNDGVLAALDAARGEIRARVEQTASADSLALARFRDALDDREGLREAIRHYSVVIASTCQQSVSKAVSEHVRAGLGTVDYHTVLCDEAARANPLDLLIPMTRATHRIVLVGDHRQLPHIVEEGIEEALFGDHAQSDDASAETGRAHAERALQESLFERVFHVLSERESRDGIRRVVTLNEQFRMHPRLGRFVSDQFYPARERFASPRGAQEFEHGFAPFAGRCAAWIDVPGEREARVGPSRARRGEAQAIVRALKPMLEQAIEEGSAATFGVITFYSAQVKAVEDELVREGVMVRREDGSRRCADRYIGRLRVGTVDAFQGREFDVVFLSVVRSNDHKTPRGKFGHLMSPNRMCVSMSRQKKLLVVAGDLALVRDRLAPQSIPALVAFEEIARSEEAAARGDRGRA